LGEASATRFNVLAAGAYLDDRIATMDLRPDPGAMKPVLRSVRGEIAGVKVLFRGLQGKRVRVRVYAVDSGLCRTTTTFELWIQGVILARYGGSGRSGANWTELGPFDADADGDGNLVVEGRHFNGLGGIAGIRIERVE
jgi:hypothetical protein